MLRRIQWQPFYREDPMPALCRTERGFGSTESDDRAIMGHERATLPSRAVAWMVAAVACFSLMDAGMKQLSASYPTLEVTFLRGAASLPFVLVWVLASAGPRSLVPRRWGCTCCVVRWAWR